MGLDNNMFVDEIFASDEIKENAIHTTEELLDWIRERNETLDVKIDRIGLSECRPWYYDESEGCIRNESRSFFQIYGLKQYRNDALISEQPVIVQDEIGFLGIITRKIEGTWHYLMQAKIEPGNVNVVQLSPTLQATKSNFTRAHGGRTPDYLDYFLNMNPDDILVDQIQSEQSSRFLKKRNRNVILCVKEDIPETDSHKWMTLKQIKEFMHYDNLVNMDTRTVLSCIPYVLLKQDADVPFRNKPYFYKTAWTMNRKVIASLYHEINDIKMLGGYRSKLADLSSLSTWKMNDDGIICTEDNPYSVIFCDINIEGREVTHWKQPLFASNGKAVFGLICSDDDGVLKFLVKIRPEAGCFDTVEIGPTVQNEFYHSGYRIEDPVEELFFDRLNSGRDVIIDCILSEEGGRFYQEENRNVIMYVDRKDITGIPKEYVWSDYGTLNILTQINNCLNIQLRNLLSLFEI